MTFIPEAGTTDPALRRDNVLAFIAAVAIRINDKLTAKRKAPKAKRKAA